MRPDLLCACSLLRRAARDVSAIYDAALKPTGLRITQFTVLRTLDRLGPLPITRLAEMCALDRSTMGRNLDPLEREGLVKLKIGKDDKRERVAGLTASGEAELQAALPHWRAAQRQVIPLIDYFAISDLPEQVSALRDKD